jgi:hypothetical protein
MVFSCQGGMIGRAGFGKRCLGEQVGPRVMHVHCLRQEWTRHGSGWGQNGRIAGKRFCASIYSITALTRAMSGRQKGIRFFCARLLLISRFMFLFESPTRFRPASPSCVRDSFLNSAWRQTNDGGHFIRTVFIHSLAQPKMPTNRECDIFRMLEYSNRRASDTFSFLIGRPKAR